MATIGSPQHSCRVRETGTAHEELHWLGCKGTPATPDTCASAAVGLHQLSLCATLAKLMERLVSYFHPFACSELELEQLEEARKANALVPFLCLPSEVVFHVLCFLSAKDLALVQLTCTALSRYVRDEWLWKRLCERDYSPVKNAVAQHFGKSWEWVYRSKNVIFTGSNQIKDGDVGTLITKDGRYEGEWRSGKLNGYGFLVSSVGNIIEGQWKGGMGHGYGRVAYANGDFYAGQWTDGGVTGKGVCYFMEGTIYKGDWKDNAVHGTGICWFSDGNMYEGQWKLGKKDGPGVFQWKNGASWRGTWKNNRPEGKGRHYCPASGEVMVTEWQNEFTCCCDYKQPKDASAPPAIGATPIPPLER